MQKLNYKESIQFWQKNDKAKRNLNRISDPEGFRYGIYDDFPVWINRYYAFFQNLVLNRFLKQIPVSGNDHILEIGCGSGRWCYKMLKQPHKSITGLDIGYHILLNNLKLYKEKINFVNALASVLPIKNDTIDLVFSVAVLHHLPVGVQVSALAEISRILKPGKYFLLIESTTISPTSHHLFARTFDDWTNLVEDHDFRVVDVTGQEYIDFRKIIRPLRKKIKALMDKLEGKSGNFHKQSTRNTDDENKTKKDTLRISFLENVFYFLFLPMVYAAYPIELVLYAWCKREKANYICLLMQKNPLSTNNYE